MTTVKIVWDGCDSYTVSNESVFTQREEFKPFEVIEIDATTLPKDEEGEVDFTGFFLADDGKTYKAV